MKSILKLSALAILLTVTSCAHHGKCHETKETRKCEMKDCKKDCSGEKAQCQMKKEETKTEEVKK